MEIHNISEDSVFKSVQKICDELKKEGNKENLCLCRQCRLDTICYVLNRVEPRYVVSNRGMTRFEQDWAGRQQTDADIAILVYKGLRLVNHNKRPNSLHEESASGEETIRKPVFNIPTITGRIFDGETFAPIVGANVELRCEGQIVPMRNSNWQNPFTLVANTPGIFTFWPAPIFSEAIDVSHIFEYSLKVESSEYEMLSHFFNISAVSNDIHASFSHEHERSFKLPDLYLFRPGEAEQNG